MGEGTKGCRRGKDRNRGGEYAYRDSFHVINHAVPAREDQWIESSFPREPLEECSPPLSLPLLDGTQFQKRELFDLKANLGV